MNGLYNKCEILVKESIKQELNEDLLDVLTISVFGIFLFIPDIAENKIIQILNNLKILVGKDKFDEFNSGNHLCYDNDIDNFGVKVSISYNKEQKNEIGLGISNTETKMFILNDIKEENCVKSIAEVIHALLHLLRYNGYIKFENTITHNEGISSSVYDITNNTLLLNKRNLEEGIVEKCVEDILFLIKENYYLLYETNNSFVINFVHLLDNYDLYNNSYSIHKDIIKALCAKLEFDKFIEKSFSNESSPLIIEKEFDGLVNKSCALVTLSDKLNNYLKKQNENDINISLRELVDYINELHKEKKIKHLF